MAPTARNSSSYVARSLASVQSIIVKIMTALVLFLILFPLAPLRAVIPVAAEEVTLRDILAAQKSTLSSLNDWLATQPVVYALLSGAGNVTFLAPSNAALASLTASPFADQLTVDTNLLTAYLAYHAFPGAYPLASLGNNASVPAFPSTLMNLAGFSNVSGGQVLRINTEEGVVSLVSGDGAEATVLVADLNYTGGVVHIIDAPLSIPARPNESLLSAGLTAAVGAMRRAGVEDSLSTACTDLTVFAPNNQAFNVIGSLIDNMTSDELSTVLGYHVIRTGGDNNATSSSIRNRRVLYSTHLRNGAPVAGNSSSPLKVVTTQGTDLYVRVINGEIYVNGARVIVTDVLMGNGVFHVIDSVLNPANATATPHPELATQPPAWPDAYSTPGGVPFTTGVVVTTSTGTSTVYMTVNPPPTIPPRIDAAERTAAPFPAALVTDRQDNSVWETVAVCVLAVSCTMVFLLV
ncbi:hypothetical protein VTJ49DRAFT_2500 [Mycothermus thermophilus]|uniref:FAS1 domain-containing protein n=1 Tax=Humicola insolens TaxID=85995 RepID=A0ABR3V9X9_HUMIN